MMMIAAYARPHFQPIQLRLPNAGTVAQALAAACTVAAGLYLAVYVMPKLPFDGAWAYLSAFVVSMVSSATVFVPLPGVAVLIALGQRLDPLLLSVLAGVGGAVGEVVAYWLGFKGRQAIKGGKLCTAVERGMQRRGGLVVFACALLPFLPMDAAGLVAGATRYSLTRFVVYSAAGKTLLMLATLWGAKTALAWAIPGA